MSTTKIGILACMLLVAYTSFLEGVDGGIVPTPVSIEPTPSLIVSNSTELTPVLRALQQNYRGAFHQILQYFNASTFSNKLRLERVEAQNIILRHNNTELQEELDEVERVVQAMGSDVHLLEAQNLNLNQDLAKLKAEGILSNPMARLFSGENLTGEAEMYNFATAKYEGGCHDLVDLSEKVKSVDTFGKCVRLFLATGCAGWSLAVYPGSGYARNVLNSKLTMVSSVGPCIPNEFEPTISIRPSENEILKDTSDLKNSVPDLLEFVNVDKLKLQRNTGNSYLLGPQNRIEFLRVVIKKSLLAATQPEIDMEQNEFYQSLEKEEGDVVGYMQPKSLGGYSEAWNVFPQTLAGKYDWARATADIHPYLSRKGSKWVTILTNVMYENESSTRPYAFYYFINYDSKRISYGRIAN